MPSLSLAIDRSGMPGALDPLVLDGTSSEAVWGLLPNWQLPERVANITYATSPFLHGGVPTSWTWQQGFMSGDITVNVDSPTALHTAYAELVAAIGRLSYQVQTVWNGITTTWECDPGSLTQSPVEYEHLRDDQPVFLLNIPCHPIGVVDLP